MMYRVLIASGLLIFTTHGLSAATLQAMQGDVLVNSGDGFKRVTGPTQVNPGDYVMVGDGGKANLVYPGGTVVPVQEGGVIAVAEQPPVIDPNAAQPPAGAEGAAPADAAAGDAAAADAAAQAAQGGLFSGTSGVVLGAVGAAAVVGGVVALASSNSSNSSPASP